MKDLLSRINPKPAIIPQVQTNSDAAIVGAIIDRSGYESVTYVIVTGALTDADATFAVTMEHGDDSALADTAAVPADQLVVTLALASFTFAGDSKCFKVGYIGTKQYTRLTITPTGNGAGAAPIAAICVLGHAHQLPTDNPPT